MCRIMNTVAKPANIKEMVATSDLGDRRESPHIPWPLVQPEPYWDPKPTSKPATMIAR